MEKEKQERKESISLATLDNDAENLGMEFLKEGQNTDEPVWDEEQGTGLDAGTGSSPFWRRRLQPVSLRVRTFYRGHAKLFRWIFLGLMCTAYAAFVLTACLLNFQRALALFILTCVVLFFLTYNLVKKLWGEKLLRNLKPLSNPRVNLWLKRCLGAAALVGLVLWLALDTSQRPEQLVSFAGVCMFIIFLFACSKHHFAVSWRAVLWGLGLQFVLGIFIIRTEPGFVAFRWLGDQIKIFLDYTVAGSSFVFGDMLVKNTFAFQVLPIIIFFSCVMSILYYLGLMQWLILKISWLMQVTMGTTATETLSVAGNIFVSQTEAPLLIRPYLADMTLSEIHVVITGGYATIAGSLLGAYISFGIDPSSLIAASVMAAPCALALSKLVYPEVEESKFKSEEGVKLSYGEAQNLLEATTNGAAISVGLIANIAANLIAFLAVLAFINAALSWLGEMVDIQELSFQLICSYILRPVAFMLGVEWADCPIVAEMLGIKLFLNEFVAYQELSKYKNRRLQGAEEWIGGKKQWISKVIPYNKEFKKVEKERRFKKPAKSTNTLKKLWLYIQCSTLLDPLTPAFAKEWEVRAEIISTFALCGFANFSSIGIMLGGLTSMVPHRKSEFSKIIMSALLTGACVSLVNACVAGILYVPRGAEVNCFSFLNTSFNNSSYDAYVCCKQVFQSMQLMGTSSPSFTGSRMEFTTEMLTNCCRFYNHTACV